MTARMLAGDRRALGGWPGPEQRLLSSFFRQFFRKYLTPEERADVILVALEAMATASRNDSSAASKMLTAILKSPMADIGKVAAPRDLAVQGQRKGASFPLCFGSRSAVACWLGKCNPLTNPDEKRLNEALFAVLRKALPHGDHLAPVSSGKGRGPTAKL